MGLDRTNIRKPRVIELEEVMESVQVELEPTEQKEEELGTSELINISECVVEIIDEEKVEEKIEEEVNKEEQKDLSEAVICLNTNEIYADNKEASEKTGVNAGSIKRCCNGDIKSAGKDKDGNKLVWKYLRDL